MADAVAEIDAFLSDVRHQSLIDGDKVRDFLLDLRLSLDKSVAPDDQAALNYAVVNAGVGSYNWNGLPRRQDGS